ncbi:uncharacterized protein METZ01_LOCUS213624 [marine metagenome]|uniref:Uncharacterized protein n=1 Tax=marine metagenome TaxID=408172 RepID=A0A382FCX7_9ZZZZ
MVFLLMFQQGQVKLDRSFTFIYGRGTRENRVQFPLL